MKRAIIVSVGLLCAVTAAAQEEDAAVKAALYLNGASTAEELEADEIERLQVIGKVRVNAPGRNARAILSEYQLAALDDYRRRCGDILSWEELSLVDGFGKEAVEALKPYLSLWSDNLPGAVDTLPHFMADLLVRATEKNLGTKLKAGGKNWQVAGALRTKSWGSGDYDWTASAEFGNGRWSLLVGNFNVRYGQGLGIWSGFSMSSLSTIDAFIKRPTGIRPVCSFTPSQHRGLAGEYHLGRWSLAAFADLQRTAGLHASYVSLRSQLGLTLLPNRASTDFALNYKGIDFVGELSASLPNKTSPSASGTTTSSSSGTPSSSSSGLSRGSHVAAILATKLKIKDIKLSLQTRAIPSAFSGKKNGEYGAAAGAQWKSNQWQQLKGHEGFGSSVSKHVVSLTADASLLPVPQKDPGRKQLRIYGLWQWQMSETLALETKFTGRYRTWEPSRSDIRLDVKYSNGQWFGATRIESDFCDGPGVLSYLEISHKGDQTGSSNGARLQGWAAYFRIGAFSTSGWASRIYCYERDAPGTFTVPAYSGQGLTSSLYGTLKARIGKQVIIKLCARAGYVITKTQSSPTLRIQLEIKT